MFVNVTRLTVTSHWELIEMMVGDLSLKMLLYQAMMFPYREQYAAGRTFILFRKCT